MSAAEQAALMDFTWQAQGASWPFFALTSVVFVMRTVSRTWFTEVALGWEDIVLSISYALDVVRMVSFQLAISAVRRLDPMDLPNTVPDATFWALFTDIWAFISCTLPKIGVAILLIRVFRPQPWVRKALLGSSIGLFIFCVVGFIISYVQCNPVAGQWDPFTHPDVKCWPRDVQIDYALVGSSMSAFLDLVFAIYPGFVIAKLQMPMWKKASTMALMGLGLASFAFAIVKVIGNSSLLGNPSLTELYVNALHIGLWNSIENDFIMLAACLPSVPPLFVAFRRSLGFKTTQYGSSTGGKWSFDALKSGRSGHARIEEHSVELAQNAQQPGSTDRSIYVKYDITLERERAKSEEGSSNAPSYAFNKP